MANAVNAWLHTLSPESRQAVERLRAIVRAAEPGLTESIKWNAPNFSDGGQDRVTLGLDRKGGYRLVLHRGAGASDASGFVFHDPAGLARWPAPDRGVVSFPDAAAIACDEVALQDLIRRWLEATRA